MSTEKINECGFFSERLKDLRGDRNKAEFARELGLTAQTYQHYENGRIPRPDILSGIADRCGVTADWLLGREDSKHRQSGEAGRTPGRGNVQLRPVPGAWLQEQAGILMAQLPTSKGGEVKTFLIDRIMEILAELRYRENEAEKKPAADLPHPG